MIVVASMAGALLYTGLARVRAQSSATAAVTGQVSSKEEGSMEGVLVGVKREGAAIAVTVVSDDKGRYSFPQDRLQPGRYSLRIRAAGYDLENSGPVEITAGKTAELDLKLRKTAELASQLSNAEWLLSMPGTKQQKVELYNCTQCHSLERIVRSRHTADEWVQVLGRMTYYVGSTPLKPQRRPPNPPEEIARQASVRQERDRRFVAAGGMLPQGGMQGGGGGGMGDPAAHRRREIAQYLSTVNLSKGPAWGYELKTLPRPKGRGTRAIITTYELPRKETMVHDANAGGPDGLVWYTDFGSQFFGTLDPKTGKVTEYPVPTLKPGFPEGLMDIRFDKEGNVWMGMMAQGGIAKFDRKTQKLVTYPLPPEMNGATSQVAMVMPYSSHVDGKVWSNNVGYAAIQRLDVKTGEMETIQPYAKYTRDANDHGTYGINADAQNNLYVDDIRTNMIVKIDAKTREAKFYNTPTPDSGPRRARMDSQFNLWVALSRADKFARFDPKTESFQEWASPTPFSQIYDIMPDEYGDVWAGGMTSDFVYRLNPQTSQITQYLLPKINTNIRRVDVDSTTKPPQFWVGDNQTPTIYRLEVLD
ncbi:MAG: hypothetical protein A3J28_12505 [Acidobacteria bacterium RIFCSPLOWO2_12_FULL_60_22]|nr:MAG: hypothetical protein A3J28_12505 [Acidobacteria bacterium RIFCSPLOWO2_12_FULL_60_22]